MPRFPPRGPHGRLFPRFNGTIKALRLPAAHPAAFRFLHLAVPREHASFRSRRRCVQQRRAWGWSPGIPAREFFRGNSRSSQVPGEPQFPFAHVLRPRPADASLTNCGTLAWPPLRERRRHRREDFRGSIAWLSGSPPTCHDVGYPSPRKTGFQALVKLSWTGFHPQSSYKRFSTHFMWVGLPFQASWHNPLVRPGVRRAAARRGPLARVQIGRGPGGHPPPGPACLRGLVPAGPGLGATCEWPAALFGDSIWTTAEHWPGKFKLRVVCVDASKGRSDKQGDYSAIVFVGVACCSGLVELGSPHFTVSISF